MPDHTRLDYFSDAPLVQNALDATYIQQAKAFKGSARYTPRIIITCLVDPDGQVIAVRVDDNGIGMSIREVQDTLLTVASSQRNSTVVQQLLKESGKQLIATFGIGLLSCLKVATSVEVRTYRDGEIPVELSLAGVEREVRPREGSPDTVGTSIIVRLDTSRSPALEFDDAIEAYLVQVRQADVYLHTTIDEDVLDCPRSDMFALAQEGAFDLVEAFDPSPIEFSWELGAESFDGWVWIDASEPADAISQMRVGKMTILNDGIYVTDSDSDEWLDPELSYLTGMLNFRAGALNLAASRDAVRLDTRYEAMRREVTARARNYIGYLANMTRHRQPISGSSWKPHSRADLPLLAISSTYRALVTNKQPVEWLLRQLDGYSAELFGGALRELQHFGSPAEQSLYATYFSGRTVDDLGTFNNYPLYYKPDAVSKLESLLLVDSGKDVLFARTFDTNPRINEFDLLKAYFSRHGRQLVDVVRAQRFDVPIRSRGISKRARAHIGSGVKFLDFPAFPEQMAWRLQGETWLNTSNPRIAGLHRLLARDDITVEQLIPAKMLIDLLGFKFDDVVNHLLSALILDDAPLA